MPVCRMKWLTQTEQSDWREFLRSGMRQWAPQWLGASDGLTDVSVASAAARDFNESIGVLFNASTMLSGKSQAVRCWISICHMREFARKFWGDSAGPIDSQREIVMDVLIDALVSLIAGSETEVRAEHAAQTGMIGSCFRSADSLSVAFSVESDELEIICSFGEDEDSLEWGAVRGVVAGRLEKQLLIELCGHQRMPFEVTLGCAEIEIGALSDLAIGDVIRLDSDIDKPLRVTAKGENFGEAFLGALEGRKAIQLT